MKLKGFDLDEIFDYEIENEKIDKIKEELRPYVIYFNKKDTIGICFVEQKLEIVKILKKYKSDIKLLGRFKNLSSIFKDEDYDWGDVILGEIVLDGNKVWYEFAELLESEESVILNHMKNQIESFEFDWYRLQRISLRIALEKKVKEMQEKLNEIVENAENEYCKFIGINERKDE